MVLRGDLDAPACAGPDRVVAAAVPELQLVRFPPNASPSSWWPRQMPKIGLADELAEFVLRVRHRFRIARAIGEEDAVGLRAEDLFARASWREDGHVAAGLRELAEDVAFTP